MNISIIILLSFISFSSFAINENRLEEQKKQAINILSFDSLADSQAPKEPKEVSKTKKRQLNISEEQNEKEFADLEAKYFDQVKTSASGIKKKRSR